MGSAIISGKSKKDIQLLMAIAKRMGMNTRFISIQKIEDAGLVKAILQGKTGKYINTDKFLMSLK